MINEKDPTDSKIAMITKPAFCKTVEWKCTKGIKRGQQMSFEMALASMKQGKKIRRAYWPKGIYLTIFRDDVLEIDEVEGEYGNWWFTSADLLDNDWEIVE